LDRLGRNLRYLVNTVYDLFGKGIGFKVRRPRGANCHRNGQWELVFGIFAALAEFERDLISERTIAGLASARARGRNGGAPYKMTPAKLRLAMASMGQRETKKLEIYARNSGSHAKRFTVISHPIVSCVKTGKNY